MAPTLPSSWGCLPSDCGCLSGKGFLDCELAVQKMNGEARYSLKDPVEFAQFLRQADVRLVRVKYLSDLFVSKRPLPRRQEAELERFTSNGKTESALVSHEEVESWAKGAQDAIICSISHAWETREHPDPCRYQLQQIISYAGLFRAGFKADVWIFYDYISLFQFERDAGHQQSSFGKAMENMHIMYSHECSMTFRIENLTPEDIWEATKLNEKELISVFDASSKCVMAKPLKDLVENRTKYVDRGWCKAEIEWSSLRTVNAQHQRIDFDGSHSETEETRNRAKPSMNGRIPMTPQKFREKMEQAQFTHRSDAESVIHLQEKIFYEKVTACEVLVLEGLPPAEILALSESLPSYQNLKSLSVINYKCSEEEAKALAQALANSQIEKLRFTDPADEASGSFMTKAVAEVLKSNKFITDMSFQHNELGPEEAQVVAEVLKTNRSIRRLNLMNNGIAVAGAQALAEALKINTTLWDLYLLGNGTWPPGTKALAEALKTNSSLRDLGLELNGVNLEAAEALAEALKTNRSVRSINLDSNAQIGSKGAQAFAEALKTNSSVRMISLQQSGVDAEGVQAFVEALQGNVSVQHVILKGKEIDEGSQAFKALQAALRNRAAKDMDDGQEEETADQSSGRKPLQAPVQIEVIAKAFKCNSPLREIRIWRVAFSLEMAEAVGEALKANHSVDRLWLENNSLGPTGAKALAAAFTTNRAVRELFVTRNEMGAEGVKAFAESLKSNDFISVLRLEGNGIGPEGAEALADALKINRSVCKIWLNDNGIGCEGAKALAEALKSNDSMDFMDLHKNDIEAEGVKAIAEAVQINTSLRRLNFSIYFDGKPGPAAEALREAIEERKKKGIDLEGVTFFDENTFKRGR